VNKWLSNDVYSDYAESLEQNMDDVLASGTGNHDILRTFRLKAEHPEKYLEKVKVLNANAPLKTVDKLREIAKKDLEHRELAELETPTVEGEFREVSATSQAWMVQPTPHVETGGDTHVISRCPEAIPMEVSHTAKRQVADKRKANALREVNRR
jgi:hypothetical protein